MRNLISLADLTSTELACIVARAVAFARENVQDRPLTGHHVGIYFRKSSTRTRTSFWSGAIRLGADVITFGPDELQLTTGETLEDTSRVLGQYLDALVVRTNGSVEEMRRLGASSDLAVVNALSLNEHPTQAIADLSTLTEHFGSLAGRHLLVVGDGNSSGAALALAGALTPELRITLLCPENYKVPKTTLELADELSGGLHQVRQITDPGVVEGPVDAIYTSRWQTMGTPKADPNWLAAFEGFSVDSDFFERHSCPHTIFLHDLPAVRGQEVTDEILDGECSLAWRQAYHKMTAAMAVLEWCVVGIPSLGGLNRSASHRRDDRTGRKTVQLASMNSVHARLLPSSCTCRQPSGWRLRARHSECWPSSFIRTTRQPSASSTGLVASWGSWAACRQAARVTQEIPPVALVRQVSASISGTADPDS